MDLREQTGGESGPPFLAERSVAFQARVLKSEGFHLPVPAIQSNLFEKKLILSSSLLMKSSLSLLLTAACWRVPGAFLLLEKQPLLGKPDFV